MTDVPTITFVDPSEIQTTYRIGLWAAPGEGKTVAACSAPTPILALNADRPSAFAFARKYHGLSADDLREFRYVDASSLAAVYHYLQHDGRDVATVILDPFSNIYDQLVDTAPKRKDGEVDWLAVNKKILGFLTSLRRFDVHVVLLAHEKLNDGAKGDGKLYPAFGGPSLINKVLAELDVCARIVPQVVNDERAWVGYPQPTEGFVGKDGTGALGPKRIVNLTRWIELAREATAQPTSEADLPWGGDEPSADPPSPSTAEGADPAAAPSTEASVSLEAQLVAEFDGTIVEDKPKRRGRSPLDAEQV